jgi:hypothetical protein
MATPAPARTGWQAMSDERVSTAYSGLSPPERKKSST